MMAELLAEPSWFGENKLQMFGIPWRTGRKIAGAYHMI